MDSKMQRYKQMFLDECEEHIKLLETSLAAMRAGNVAQDIIDSAFRAAHSIKGGAGMVGFSRIVPFADTLETVLDAVRTRELRVDEELAACLVRSVDCLADIIIASGKGIDLPLGFEAPHTLALAQITKIRFGAKPDEEAGRVNSAEASPRCFQISFRPHNNMLRRANDPILILRQLSKLGEIQCRADVSRLPAPADVQTMDSYLSWDIRLITAASESDVRSAFEFVIDDCDLHIAEDSQKSASTPEHAPEPDLATQPLGNSAKTVRVDIDRIDRLVNLVGEIAISQALVTQLIDQALLNDKPQLVQELSQLLSHTQILQDSVMAIRAQPIRNLFDRMPRLVRELAEQTSKKIILRVSGEATEIDKTVVEQLSDPLVHMIRNSADHGLESPEQRRAAGKPEVGVISLKAEQRGSRIVIEIADDGRGIDREQVRRRAIQRHLISEDDELTLDETDALIFMPGFSTTDNVTSISGRGVGLDVVKRNIMKLGGRISIRSESGKGSVFTLTLPLTLAVLEGMIVRSGEEHYVIPVSNVFECRSSWRSDTRLVPGSGYVMHLRGNYLPVSQLHKAFRTRAETDIDNSVAIITELENGGQLALVVDEIIGQQQVVVKSVADSLPGINGVAGATILGNGRVALILDVNELTNATPGAARLLAGEQGATPGRKHVA